MNVSSSPRLLARFLEPSPCCSAPREPRAAAGASRRRELRARAPPWGAARHAPDRAATGVKAGGRAELTPRSLECLRGGEGRHHRDIPTRVRCRGGSTRSSVLVTGELRVDAEGAGPQHEGPMMFFSPRRSSSGGARPRGQISLHGMLRPWPAT
jgi:hypothetical protein